MNTQHGLMAARYLRAMHMAHSTGVNAGDFTGLKGSAAAFAASQNWPSADRIVTAIKAGVGASNDDDLRAHRPIGIDLAEAVRPLTILGRLQGIRRAPFHARLIGMSVGAVAHWRANGVAIPVSGATFTTPATLSRKAVGALLVTTNELLRDSSPVAERAFIADLAGAVAQATDAAFIDRANAGSDSTPAAITRAGSATASTGNSLAQIDADLAAAVNALIAAGSNLVNAAWVLHPRTARFLSSLRGTGGALAHPGLSVLGGVLQGLPAIVSAGMPMVAGSPTQTQIALVDGDGVLLADDGDAELSFARDAMLEMDTEPTGDSITPAASTKSRVSMFQTESVGVKVVRSTNWLPRRAVVAHTITGVTY